MHLPDPDSGVELTLNGWDFGGQPVYRPTHQLFFSAPAVYLVVWKPREGAEQNFVPYWCQLIRRRAFDETRPEERPRVLVVATHGGPKARQAHVDEQSLREVLGDLLVGFYHVDSKTGYGLDELKETIARTTSALPNVGRRYPGRWQRVRESLSKRDEPYLKYDQFQAVCRSHGLNNEQTKLFAVVAHTLGQIIHYADDESLRDVVVLKADWISKAISFTLEDKQIKDQNGLVQHSRLGALWNDEARPEDERYPTEVHPIFLRLMERFDLSYRVVTPGEPRDTSLIAQLVPSARPKNLDADWGDSPLQGDAQRTQVCRIVDAETGDPARAEGLFYQLIVRLHRFSLGRDDYALSRHWQRGLVLDDEYNGRALLELLSGDVRITTRAAYPGFFLHQLSQEVKWLAEHFWKGLRCQITVPCSHPCGVDDPGRGLFEVGKLIESRRRGRLDYPCPIPKCDVWQNINALLANAPMPQADDLAALLKEGLAELRRGQKEIKQAAHGDYQALDARLRERMSQADEQFAAVMTTLTDEGRDGPRLFSLRPVRPDRWDMPGWRSQKIRLTLWCEHSRLPLPVLWGDATRGVYVFEQPREWLVKAAPLAQFMAGMLNLVLPVAGSAVQWALDETTFKKIQDDLDLSIQSFSALLGAGGAASQWLLQANATRLPEDADQTKPHQTRRDHVRSYGWLKAAQGSLLREMQTLLRDRDPGFGGLKRVQNKRNEFLWIHPRFEKEYYPDPPIMPPPEQ